MSNIFINFGIAAGHSLKQSKCGVRVHLSATLTSARLGWEQAAPWRRGLAGGRRARGSVPRAGAGGRRCGWAARAGTGAAMPLPAELQNGRARTA